MQRRELDYKRLDCRFHETVTCCSLSFYPQPHGTLRRRFDATTGLHARRYQAHKLRLGASMSEATPCTPGGDGKRCDEGGLSHGMQQSAVAAPSATVTWGDRQSRIFAMTETIDEQLSRVRDGYLSRGGCARYPDYCCVYTSTHQQPRCRYSLLHSGSSCGRRRQAWVCSLPCGFNNKVDLW